MRVESDPPRYIGAGFFEILAMCKLTDAIRSRRCLFVSLGLLFVVVCGAGVMYWSRPHHLGSEYIELVNGFKERRYASLNEIEPQPYRVVESKDMFRPTPGARYFLYYLMRDENDDLQMLVICLDERLEYIDYFVRRDD